MSRSFTGFSEDDIQKVKSGRKTNSKKTMANDNGRRYMLAAKRSLYKDVFTTNKTLKEKFECATVSEIPDSARLDTTATVSNGQDVVEHSSTNSKLVADTVTTNLTAEIGDKENNIRITKAINCVEGKKFIDLEEFQARQRLVEEQNKRRKELLAKALADRTKQTQEETEKLKEIQDDFRKLDAMLSNDVKILRKEIEFASVEYMEAQKKYTKIEREFLNAKLNLYDKLERKEMLTEHLCTIIEKNEERKADKLNELLQKLDLKEELELVKNDNKSETSHESKNYNTTCLSE